MEKLNKEGHEEQQEGLDQEQQAMTPEEPEKETEEQQEDQDQTEWDLDMFKKLAQTEEGRKEIQRAVDKGVTKGIQTWKENNLQAEVEAEIEKRFPTDPQQKKIKELENQLKAKEIEDTAVKSLAEAGMPIELSRFFTGSGDVEEVKQGIEDLKTAFQKALKVEITERLKSIGGTPQSGGTPKRITRKELMAMDYPQREAFYKRNPDEYHRIMRG